MPFIFFLARKKDKQMKTQLNYTRSTVTVKPSDEQIQTALLKANANKLTESARMQFPKTENY